MGVDRHVGGAGPHHGEQGDHQVGGAGQYHRDERLRAGPGPAQPTGEAVRAGVQFGVRQDGAVDVEGRTGGGAPHLLGEQGGKGRPGCVAGGVVPLDERAVRVLGVQDVGPSDGQGGALEQPGEEAEEAVAVGEERGVLVQVGVCVEVEADAAGAVGGAADVHGEVPDASGGQLAGGDGAARELDGQVLGDEVDDRSGERVRRGAAEVPVEVLAAVALVADGVAHLPVGLGDQVLQGGGGVYAQPQRHLVGEHAGGGEGGAAGAGGDREAEDDVPHRGEAVQVGGDGGDEDDGPAGAGRAGRREEGGGLRLGQPGPGAQFAVRGLCGAAREAGRLRRVGEGVAPVRPVPVVGRGAEVGGVLRQQIVQGAERGGGCLGALGQRRVQLGDPAAVEDLAPAVEGDVVVAEGENVAVRGEAQQRVPVQRVPAGVDGGGEIVPHPGEGGGVRVGFAGEVDVARGCRVGHGPQPQALVVLGEAGAQRRGVRPAAGGRRRPAVGGRQVRVVGDEQGHLVQLLLLRPVPDGREARGAGEDGGRPRVGGDRSDPPALVREAAGQGGRYGDHAGVQAADERDDEFRGRAEQQDAGPGGKTALQPHGELPGAGVEFCVGQVHGIPPLRIAYPYERVLCGAFGGPVPKEFRGIGSGADFRHDRRFLDSAVRN
ncbi:hypothetical protein SGRIM128S_07330 [Streptomyces griseomycini]